MPEVKKHRVCFNPAGKSIDILSGINLLEAARLAGINISSECGGNGRCGKCRVIIKDGDISDTTLQELNILSDRDLENGYRLACCTYMHGEAKIDIPDESFRTDVKLQVECQLKYTSIDPAVKMYNIELKKPSLDDPKGDLDRVIKKLNESYGLQNIFADIAVVRKLSSLIRQEKRKIGVYIRSGEIIGSTDQGFNPVGFAVDLGTTKIAAYLIDLVTGEEVSSYGCINPQVMFGADVMSRLSYAIKNSTSSSDELTRIVRQKIGEMILAMSERAGILLEQIIDGCIAGNTAMTHLLMDLPLKQLVASPYIAASNMAMDVKVRDLLDIKIAPGAWVHILPGIGGFVGSDHVAMILASNIDRSKNTVLGIDIGTNTEIVIKRPDLPYLFSLSCPSGPAFEGAHVANGMYAAKGAIEAVKLNENGVDYRTVGDAPPIGLCGSGIIDGIAELYRWNLINERGRFIKTNKRVRQGDNYTEFRLLPEEGGKAGNNVVITQKDIDEIQLAKGAIRAGIDALLEVTGTSYEMIKEVVIAGAFGSYINLMNAIHIDMLPYFPNAEYRQVGNEAGTGVKKALICLKDRIRAKNIAEKTKYIELTTHPNFSRHFAQGMMFPKDQKSSNNS